MQGLSNPGAPPLPDLSHDAPAGLVHRRATYRNTLAQHHDNHDAQCKALIGSLEQALAALQAEFTRAKKIEEAIQVRDATSEIKESGQLPFLPLNTEESTE